MPHQKVIIIQEESKLEYFQEKQQEKRKLLVIKGRNITYYTEISDYPLFFFLIRLNFYNNSSWNADGGWNIDGIYDFKAHHFGVFFLKFVSKAAILSILFGMGSRSKTVSLYFDNLAIWNSKFIKL